MVLNGIVMTLAMVIINSFLFLSLCCDVALLFAFQVIVVFPLAFTFVYHSSRKYVIHLRRVNVFALVLFTACMWFRVFIRIYGMCEQYQGSK